MNSVNQVFSHLLAAGTLGMLMISQAVAQSSNLPLEPIRLPPQLIAPPLGYSVFEAPDRHRQPIRIVRSEDAEEPIEAAAFLTNESGRWFLTQEGLDRHRAGLPTEWLFVDEVSDLPTFRVPAYLANSPIVPEETALERFENQDFAGALPSMIHHYEQLRLGEEWGFSVFREAYNQLAVIGWCFASLGDLAQAESALDWYTKVAIHRWSPWDRRGGLVPKGNLADFYQSIGNHEKERTIRLEAFVLYNESSEEEEPAAVSALPISPVEAYRKALETLKSDAAGMAGNEQIQNFQMFLGLARLGVRFSTLEEAEALVQDLRAVLACIPDDDPIGGPEKNNGVQVLAEWELRQGNPAAALDLLKGVITRRQENGDGSEELPPQLITLLARAHLEHGDPLEAISLLEPKLGDLFFYGEDLPTRQLLLAAFLSAGKSDDAKRLTSELETLQVDRARQVLSFSSEEQRIRFMRNLRPMAGWLAMEDAEGAARVSLRFKGLSLDASLEEAAAHLRSTDPATRRLQEDLERAKQSAHVTIRLLEGGGETLARQDLEDRYRLAIAEIDRVEGLLARGVNASGLVHKALRSDPQEIVASLPPDRVVVDFVQADRYSDRNRYEPVYVVIRYASDGVSMRDCGPVDEINDLIASLREKISVETAEDVSLEPDLKALESRLFGQWLDTLATDTTVLISPDGELNFLPFAALMNQDSRTLLERFELGFLNSARDAAVAIEPWTFRKALLVGNPNFNLTPEATSSGSWSASDRLLQRSIDLRASALGSIHFQDLAGAELEARSLKGTLASQGVETTLLLNDNATESAFRSSSPVDLIHIATHGGILPDARPHGGEDLVLGQMTSGILAFAGANPTLQSWSRGTALNSLNDGIISADEFARMDLGGVQTVVMSACETGLGGTQPGEGVMGLRRGLHQAGVAHLVTTLWSIDDAATVEVMGHLFARSLAEPQSPLKAMTLTQRELFAEWRPTLGLAASLNRITPFVISLSKGRPGRRSDTLIDVTQYRPTPTTSVPSATDDEPGTEAVRRFVLAKLQAEDAHDIEALFRFYAPTVHYYQEGEISRESIAAKKRSYFERFPVTGESLRGQVSVVREDDLWTARFQSAFRATKVDGSVEFEGTQASTWLLDDSTGSLRIVSETNEILNGTRKTNGVVDKILGNRPATAPSTAPTASSLEGEKYPETRLRSLSAADIGHLTYGQVRYAINEMFARHGAVFNSSEIQAVFERFSWYQPRAGWSFEEIEAQLFSSAERENLKVLGSHRDRVKR
jgi:CHAT domain-containing protein